VIFARQRDDRLDGRDLMAHFKEDRLLDLDGRVDRQAMPVPFVENLHDACRRDAAEARRRAPRENRARARPAPSPRPCNASHGVGQRAVAIEDVGVEIAGRAG